MKFLNRYNDVMEFCSNFTCVSHTNIFLVNKNLSRKIKLSILPWLYKYLTTVIYHTDSIINNKIFNLISLLHTFLNKGK